ncbi:MAG: hypothetical protein ACKORB_03755 [Opitutia bacterium]
MRTVLLLCSALAAAPVVHAEQIKDLPPPPPRMTVEGTPGADYAMAFYERSQMRVKPSVTAELHKAIDDAKLPNLVKLHSAARIAREKAVRANDAAVLVRKAQERAKADLDKAQAAYDKAPRSQKTAKKRILDKAQGDFEDADRICNRRESEDKEATEAYDAALNAYVEARQAADPAVESLKKAAGIS